MLHLYILEILRKYSSKNKPLLQKKIIDKLSSDYAYKVERKSVGRALAVLTSLYHVNKVNNKGWYIDDEIFDPSELRYLIDSVLFSKHVPANYAQDLIKKLQDLGKNDFKKTVGKVVLANTVKRTDIKAVFYNLELIAQAISDNLQIEFLYNEYGIDKKRHPVSDEKIVLNPLSLYINEYYYVVGVTIDGKDEVSYRVDMISDLTVTDLPRISQSASFDIGNYISTHPYSHVGKPERIVFWIDKCIVNELIEAFPDFHVDTDEALKTLVIVNANLADAEDWCKRFGDHVEVVYPQKLRNSLQSFADGVYSVYTKKEDDRYYEQIESVKRELSASGYAALDLRNVDLTKKSDHTGLTKVKSVVLSDNNISDASFLKDFKKLESLRIENNPVSDLSFLANLKGLKNLSLCGTKVNDISFLRSNGNLTELELIDNEITDFSCIYDLFDLCLLNMNLASALTLDLDKLKNSCPFLRITVPEISDIRSNVERLLAYDKWISHGIKKVELLFEKFVDKPEIKQRAAFSKEEANKALDFLTDRKRFTLFEFRQAVRLSNAKEAELISWLIDCGIIAHGENPDDFVVIH